MSHYCVAVFSNKPDDESFRELLAPYDENNYKSPHVYDLAEVRKRYKKFLENNPGWKIKGFRYYLKEFGYKLEDHKLIKYYNDNAKWDYYSLDGKEYMFDVKPDRTIPFDCGRLRKDNYDYEHSDFNDSFNDDEYDSMFWDWHVEGKPWTGEDMEPEDPPFSRAYYLKRYGTKEGYLKAMSRPIPYAYITPDGTWHSPGIVGWFASDDSTRETWDAYTDEWNAFISSADNPYVSFVDCHI